MRWPVIIGWVCAAAAATLWLPGLGQSSGGSLGTLIPDGLPALEAERFSRETFRVPLRSHTAIVQRDVGGLSLADQRAIIETAVDLTRGTGDRVLGALPLINYGALFPGPDGRPTTAVTLVLLDRGELNEALAAGGDVAQRFDRATPGLPPALVTGVAPARDLQGILAKDRLSVIELVTAAFVALVVALHFRSPVAPLLVLATVGMAYLLASRALGLLATHTDIAVPAEIAPVVVVLLFGVVTDYCVFFLGRLRQRLDELDDGRDAARAAIGDVAGVVSAAVLAVAAASLALLVARVDFIRGFGPGTAIAVLVAWAVVVTFVPAVMAVAGARLFWPRSRRTPPPAATPGGSRTVRLAARRPVVAAVLALVVLAAGGSGLLRMELGQPAISGLAGSSEIARGAETAAAGFGAGILSPTEIIVRGDRVAFRADALARFERLVDAHSGVAAVFGPDDLPTRRTRGILRSRTADAARLIVLLEDDPLGPAAMRAVEDLRADLPALLHEAGLPAAQSLIAGDTAISAQTVDAAVADLTRIIPAVLAALLVVLMVYLRAIVAPLYLVGASVAGLAAALGVTVYVNELLGYGSTAFIVPVAAGVLLVALGSDYNIFLAGRIWREARERPLRRAIVVGGGAAASSIAVAGIVLATSFALLAVIPTATFRQLAVAMTAGLLLDTFVVRTLLVPALIAIVGARSSWPGAPLGATGSPATSGSPRLDAA